VIELTGYPRRRDSLSEVELTPAQREEAERRLLEHESNPGECISWEELKRQLEGER
jgi:putative addiction module component (TIGR02574 family)